MAFKTCIGLTLWTNHGQFLYNFVLFNETIHFLRSNETVITDSVLSKAKRRLRARDRTPTLKFHKMEQPNLLS